MGGGWGGWEVGACRYVPAPVPIHQQVLCESPGVLERSPALGSGFPIHPKVLCSQYPFSLCFGTLRLAVFILVVPSYQVDCQYLHILSGS